MGKGVTRIANFFCSITFGFIYAKKKIELYPIVKENERRASPQKGIKHKEGSVIP